MMVTKFALHIPTGKALKRAEKDKINQEIIDSFHLSGDPSVKIEETYYESKHAAVEIITYVVTVMSVTADICTIALAIREFLKKEEKVKEIKIHSDPASTDIMIRANMSDEEIRKIVSEARKISENKKRES